MALSNLFSILKGGSTSGNWGHRGRPGKRGGSTQSSSSLGALEGFAITPTLRELFKGEKTYDGDSHPIVSQIFEELGFINKPRLVDNLDAHIERGDLELHRGVGGVDDAEGVKYVEAFKKGELFIGDGIYGSGTYSAFGYNGKKTAQGYTVLSGDSGLIRMALDKSAKIITTDEIKEKLYSIYSDSNKRADKMVKKAFVYHKAGDIKKTEQLLEKSGQLRMRGNEIYKAMGGDHSIAAAAMGYDALQVSSRDYMIVLNRSKVKVEP